MKAWQEPEHFAALSSGMERALAAMVNEAHDLHVKDGLASRRKSWSAVADARWASVCREFAASLPMIDGFSVVPSSRQNRQAPLAKAVRRQFPAAIEITYQRQADVRFAGTAEQVIFDSLTLTERPSRLPKGITIIDDYIGTGRTLRAFAHRLTLDFPSCLISAAAPGINATTFRDAGADADPLAMSGPRTDSKS